MTGPSKAQRKMLERMAGGEFLRLVKGKNPQVYWEHYHFGERRPNIKTWNVCWKAGWIGVFNSNNRRADYTISDAGREAIK